MLAMGAGKNAAKAIAEYLKSKDEDRQNGDKDDKTQ